LKKIFMLLASVFIVFIVACHSSDSTPAASSSSKAITAFSLAGVVGTINETDKTIAVTMPFGTDVTALVATFTTTGSSVQVGSTVQTSGVTANNFTSPVVYTVTAADGSTQDYTVVVTVPSASAKAITAFSLNGVVGTINETGKTIAVTMPSGTNVTALVATFTTTGASVQVGSTVQTSGATANNFTSPVIYTVTAVDTSTQDYTVVVTVGTASAKAITAFFLNNVAGTINETAKTIEVPANYGTDVTTMVAKFTTTGASVHVGPTLQISGTTANDFTSPVIYTVTAADASTQDYTVTVKVGTSSSKTITAFSLDGVVGTINETKKTIAVTMPFGTDVTALVATFTKAGISVHVGSTLQISGVTANDFTSPVIYTVTAANDSTQNYKVTVTVAPSSAKAITAFSLDGMAATINETAKTITVIMPFGTDVTALVATFTTTGVSVTRGSTLQISGTTVNDFTSPVVYTVTAANDTTQNYTVTVNITAYPTVYRPIGMDVGRILAASDGQVWRVVSGSYTEEGQIDSVLESVYTYTDGGGTWMSFIESGAVEGVELVDTGIIDTANRPEIIVPGAVILSAVNGLWVVTAGSGSWATSITEPICIYTDSGDTKIAFRKAEAAFTVITMPDPSPVISSTARPDNMIPGTIILLSNGQVWKVVSGVFILPGETEQVIVYSTGVSMVMSFQTSGAVMEVELMP
jgi:hypothetical protein